MCTKTSIDDYENLGRSDVLGVINIAVIILQYIKFSRIKLGEKKMICMKLDWCGKTFLLHCRTTNWVGWKG